MVLRIRNKWHYRGIIGGRQRWAWEAFLDDNNSGELSNIKYVEYIMHPTFPFPKKKIIKPEGGFALKTGGYGSFNLEAIVYTKDGKKKKLTHLLKLEVNPENGISE